MHDLKAFYGNSRVLGRNCFEFAASRCRDIRNSGHCWKMACLQIKCDFGTCRFGDNVCSACRVSMIKVWTWSRFSGSGGAASGTKHPDGVQKEVHRVQRRKSLQQQGNDLLDTLGWGIGEQDLWERKLDKWSAPI